MIKVSFLIKFSDNHTENIEATVKLLIEEHFYGELKKLFDSLNIPDEKVAQLIEAVKVNPMSALGLVGELNIPPQVLQQMMAIAMTNPAELMKSCKDCRFFRRHGG